MTSPMTSLVSFALAAAAAESESGVHAPTPLLEDTSFYVSLGVVIVVGVLMMLKAHKKIADALDQRSRKIADELDRARALRDEAQELLAKYQRRQREAEDEAVGIIEQAKSDARRIAAEARAKIEEQLARRASAAEDKIARAEAQAIAEVRGQTADIAIDAAREIIASRMDQGARAALAEKAIDELRGKFH